MSIPINPYQLQVTIDPPEAVSAGAQWQVDGGPWQNSGAIVSSLTPGTHAVAFSTLSGWVAPANQTITISDCGLTESSGTYVTLPSLVGKTSVNWNDYLYDASNKPPNTLQYGSQLGGPFTSSHSGTYANGAFCDGAASATAAIGPGPEPSVAVSGSIDVNYLAYKQAGVSSESAINYSFMVAAQHAAADMLVPVIISASEQAGYSGNDLPWIEANLAVGNGGSYLNVFVGPFALNSATVNVHQIIMVPPNTQIPVQILAVGSAGSSFYGAVNTSYSVEVDPTLVVDPSFSNATNYTIIFSTLPTGPNALVVNSPPPVIVINDPGDCGATIDSLGTPTTSGGSGTITVSSNAPALPAQFPIGLTLVTWTATDSTGQTAKSVQLVQVQDAQPPVGGTTQLGTLENTPLSVPVTELLSADFPRASRRNLKHH